MLFGKNHKVLIEKRNVFLGEHVSKSNFGRCLSSYSSQNVLIRHNQRYEQQETASIRVSNDTQL